MCHSFASLLVVSLLKTCLSYEHVEQKRSTHELFDRLFASYNRHIRPVVNSSQVTVVDIDCILRGILGTDAVHQTIVLKEWLRMFWVDEYLRWNPDDYDGIKEIKVPRSMIWLPDITRIDLVNMVQPIDDDRSFVIVNNGGNVRHSVDHVIKVYCDYSITMFPFDQQNCTIHYEPWHSTEKEVLLHVNEGKSDMSNYRASTGLFSPTNDSGEHSEKVTMGLTSLLSMTVLLLMISENLPKTNQGLPLLGVFVLVEIFIGALATATTVYVCHMQSGWRKGRKVPLFFKYLETWSLLGNKMVRRVSDGEIFAEQWQHSSSMQLCRENGRKTGLFAQIGNFESNIRMISTSLQKRNALDRHRLKWASACEKLDRALLLLFLSTNTLFFVAIMIIGYSA